MSGGIQFSIKSVIAVVFSAFYMALFPSCDRTLLTEYCLEVSEALIVVQEISNLRYILITIFGWWSCISQYFGCVDIVLISASKYVFNLPRLGSLLW